MNEEATIVPVQPEANALATIQPAQRDAAWEAEQFRRYNAACAEGGLGKLATMILDNGELQPEASMVGQTIPARYVWQFTSPVVGEIVAAYFLGEGSLCVQVGDQVVIDDRTGVPLTFDIGQGIFLREMEREAQDAEARRTVAKLRQQREKELAAKLRDNRAI